MASGNDEIPLADEGEENTLDLNLLVQPGKGCGSSIPRAASPLPKFLINRNGALISPDDLADAEERAKIIGQVGELQCTLEDLSMRVDAVRGESNRLRGENQVLGQYIQKLMAASPLFRAVKVKDRDIVAKAAVAAAAAHQAASRNASAGSTPRK